VLVAGMRADTTYHMRATLRLTDGTTFSDTDHVFATGSLPASSLPNITVMQTGVSPPAPGIELLSADTSPSGNQLTTLATDLAGKVIWYYDLGPGEWAEPIKPLPNGHMLMVKVPTVNSQGLFSPLPPSGSNNEILEIDLAGNIITEISLDQLNHGLRS